MSTRIFVVYHSMYGHVHTLARAVAEGAALVEGSQVALFQVAETLSPEALDKMGATAARATFADVPVLEPHRLVEADAIIFGTPTRFGMMSAQMRAFLDHTGGLWAKQALVGKVGSAFTSTSTQHGGQESTILSFHTTLLHHGMVLVGLPYSAVGQTRMDEITGGSPYGASTITGPDSARLPSENELELCRFQGRHVATITAELVAGRAGVRAAA